MVRRRQWARVGLRKTAARLAAIREGLRIAWFIALGGFLLLNPQRASGGSGVQLRIAVYCLRYVVTWAVVGVAFWLWVPTWFVGSRTGLQTALQVLPATTIAVFLLVLGSVFVIAQTAVATWGTRAPVMFAFDNELQGVLARPLLLAITVLLLSGQVPDQGVPSEAVTAAVGACALATVFMIISSALLMPAVVQRYSLPRGFPQFVIESLEQELEGGKLELVVLRGPMLGEMLRLALRRGDSVATVASAEAVEDFATAYAEAVQRDSGLRTFVTDDGVSREGWFADDIESALVRAAEDALRQYAAGEDTNRVAICLSNVGTTLLRAHQREDAETCIDGLILMATTHSQAGEFVNAYAEPAFQLACVEARAEELGEAQAAVRALAGWALGIAYPAFHLNLDIAHPIYARSLKKLGENPPWTEAMELVKSEAWHQTFSNKQYKGPEPVLSLLEEGRRGFADGQGSTRAAPPRRNRRSRNPRTR
jgi:hypothetical protein